MDVKLGSNPLQQRTQQITSRSSSSSSLDPVSFKKQFGDKTLGDVLNQVSDPNWAAKKKRVIGHGNPDLDKDAFFKLMLTQLKQQDPTNPLKSHEMAAQLAQFSSVEQLSNMNQTLEIMSKGKETDKLQLLNLIGKVIKGDSGRITRAKGDKEHKIEFKLPKAADNLQVKIMDSTGKEVKKYQLQNVTKGKHQVVWNGMHEDGKDAPVGNYSAVVQASYQGRRIPVNTKFSGPVDGVQFSASGPMLVVGGKTMLLKDVQHIEINKEPNKIDKQVNVIDSNSKYSNGAIEQRSNLANLDKAKMATELKSKLLK